MLENLSWTQVSNVFIDALPELTGAEVKIMLAIFRKTIGWHKRTDVLSLSQLSELTGIKDRKTISQAVKALEGRSWIQVERSKKGSKVDLLLMGENPPQLKGGGREIQPPMVGKSDHERLENPTHKIKENKSKKREILSGGKTSHKVPIEEAAESLIEYLNKRTGRRFPATSNDLLSGIAGRAADGFTAHDIAKVFKLKCDEWVGTDFERNCRPSTLLRKSKFNEYIIEARYQEEVTDNERTKHDESLYSLGGGGDAGGQAAIS